jgi:hypothetical protein
LCNDFPKLNCSSKNPFSGFSSTIVEMAPGMLWPPAP